jgi:hypothetical protein
VITIVTDEGAAEVDGTAADGTVLVADDALAGAIGWELKPEGLCRGDVCVPARSRPDLRRDGLVDVRAVADLLGRPFALDEATSIAVVGASASTRAAELRSMHVDDFEVETAWGEPFRWSSLGRKKKVLVAWASW